MPKLTKAKLNRYRKVLLKILEELGHKVEFIEDTVLRGDNDTSPDESDEFGSDSYQRDMQINLIENESEILREVQEALERVEEGTYGVCEVCDKLIPERRLEVLPYAKHCVTCQQAMDEGRDPE